MNLVGVTIGCGPRFAAMARLASREWTRRTGRPGYVLGAPEQERMGLSTPHRLKFDVFHLLDSSVDAVAFFDADMVFLEDFDPEELLGDDGFAAVRDLHREPWIVADAARAGVPPQHYFNSGFFLIERRRVDLLALAATLTAHLRTEFRDQTHLNAAANLLGVATHYLPGRFNTHVDREHTRSLDGVIGAHVHWLRDEPAESLERFYSDDLRELFWRG